MITLLLLVALTGAAYWAGTRHPALGRIGPLGGPGGIFGRAGGLLGR